MAGSRRRGTAAASLARTAAFEPLHIVGGRVYGVAEGEMYVQRVEAYRVEDGR